MTKYEKDIYERVYEFALDVVKFARLFPRTIEADVIRKQVIRSATSVAANMQEADGARTKLEFVHTVSISKKEAKETKIWLRMVNDLYPRLSAKTQLLISENEELIKILSSIVIKVSSKK